MTAAAQTPTEAPAEALSDRQARAELSRMIEAPDTAAVTLIDTLGPVAAYQLITEGIRLDIVAADTPGLDDATRLDAVARLRDRAPVELLDLDALAADGIGVLIPEDPQWPETLDCWDTAPVALWYRADQFTSNPLDRLPDFTETIAVTGTREISDYGAQVTSDITAPLITYGHTLITGTGYGIDAASLRAALAADNPRSVTPALAVTAGGVDTLYPAGNTALLHQVAAAGLLLSEYAPGTAPTRHRLIRRNVLLAHLAEALVIPEARRASAVTHAADAALSLGRAVAVIPGSIYSAASELPNALAADPGVTAVTSAPDIGQMLAYR